VTLGEAWWSMNDQEMQASLNRQVEETERVWRYFEANVNLPVIVRECRTRWASGLAASPPTATWWVPLRKSCTMENSCIVCERVRQRGWTVIK